MPKAKFILIVGVDAPDTGYREAIVEIPFDTIAEVRDGMRSLVGKTAADAFNLPGAESAGDLDPDTDMPIMGFSIDPYDDEIGTHHDEILHFDAAGRGTRSH